MYRLMTKNCRWSLVSSKGKSSKMCCLSHHPEVKITDAWESSVKYDSKKSEQTPYDIVVDEKGNIVPMKP